MATRKSKEASGTWPKIVKGSHLTVTTHEDGRTELEWDDEQLLKEVREAFASVKKPAVKAKTIKKVPEAMKRKPAEKTVAKKATVKKTAAKKAPAKTTKAKTKTK